MWDSCVGTTHCCAWSLMRMNVKLKRWRREILYANVFSFFLLERECLCGWSCWRCFGIHSSFLFGFPRPSASLQRNKPVRVNESHNSFIRSERLSYSETLIINPITNGCLLAYFISREWSYEVRIVIPSLLLHLLLLRSLNIFCIFHVLLGFAPL